MASKAPLSTPMVDTPKRKWRMYPPGAEWVCVALRHKFEAFNGLEGM